MGCLKILLACFVVGGTFWFPPLTLLHIGRIGLLRWPLIRRRKIVWKLVSLHAGGSFGATGIRCCLVPVLFLNVIYLITLLLIRIFGLILGVDILASIGLVGFKTLV